MEWGQLTETSQPDVRTCNLCEEPVYYCTTIQTARSHAAKNRCVALDVTVERRPHDLVQMKLRGKMILPRT